MQIRICQQYAELKNDITDDYFLFILTINQYQNSNDVNFGSFEKNLMTRLLWKCDSIVSTDIYSSLFCYVMALSY